MKKAPLRHGANAPRHLPHDWESIRKLYLPTCGEGDRKPLGLWWWGPYA